MELADRSQSHVRRDRIRQIPNGCGFAIDASALYLLAGPAVPEMARAEAVERAQAGERITTAEREPADTYLRGPPS